MIAAFGSSRPVCRVSSTLIDLTLIYMIVADGEEVIPYTVWGNDSKVVLRVPTELRFHDTSLDANPLSVAKTSWVNYIFEHERGT